MKGEFISYDALSCGTKDSATPTLHFAMTGVISINAAAVTLIDLQIGDQVKLLQSKGRPKEWYLAKVKEGGFRLRKVYTKASKGLMLNNAFTVKAIMRALNVSKGFKVTIGCEPDAEGWWSLITAAMK